MPRAAKLVAALVFAAIGYAIFVSMVTVYSEDTVPGYLLPLCVVAGLIVGWQICGKNALGLKSGIGNGYTAIVTQGFIIIFVMSFITMLGRSVRSRYDGPMNAIIDSFTLLSEYAFKFATPEIGMIMLVGGFVGGALAGIAARWFPH
ncbi:MAG: TrgA family protein [Yoonia sp.]|nr:TrgA family protein [Yoonia sp.]